MDDVSIEHAKEHLEDLVRRARRGEDVRITAPDGASVRLQRVEPDADGARSRVVRVPGRWKGRLTVPERLFEPLDEEEQQWLSGSRSS